MASGYGKGLMNFTNPPKGSYGERLALSDKPEREDDPPEVKRTRRLRNLGTQGAFAGLNKAATDNLAEEIGRQVAGVVGAWWAKTWIKGLTGQMTQEDNKSLGH